MKRGDKKKAVTAVLQRFKPVFLLLGSNAFATITLSVGSFLIARIMVPAEYGWYSLAAQISVSAYPLLTLRFENSLPLLGAGRSSGLMLIGCLLLLPITFLIYSLVALICSYIPVISSYFPKELIELLPLVAFGALSLALSSVFQSAALARGILKRLAVSRVIRAIAMTAMQIGIAWSLGAGAKWVLIGEISANIVHGAILGSALSLGGVMSARRHFIDLWRRILVLLKRYKEFPLITLPHSFMHSGLGLIFTSTLGALYGAAALGQYYLMRKLIFGVIGVFNTAIYQHATAEAARMQQYDLYGVGQRALALMGSIAVLLTCVTILYGPSLFEIAIGNKWGDAGLMAVASAPLIIFEPITSTMSFLPIFLRLQHIAFFVAIVQGCVGIAALGISGLQGWSVITAITVSSLSVSVVMFSYIIWLLLQAKKNMRTNKDELYDE